MDPDRKPPSSGFFPLLIGEGSHRGSLPWVIKQEKICLWAFSEHQLSGGAEVLESR